MKKALSNRYVIIAAILLLWLVFFDRNNLIYQYRLNKEIKTLQKEQTFYLSEIENLKAQKAALSSDLDLLEKYAREKYMMKEPGEDLYLLKEK